MSRQVHAKSHFEPGKAVLLADGRFGKTAAAALRNAPADDRPRPMSRTDLKASAVIHSVTATSTDLRSLDGSGTDTRSLFTRRTSAATESKAAQYSLCLLCHLLRHKKLQDLNNFGKFITSLCCNTKGVQHQWPNQPPLCDSRGSKNAIDCPCYHRILLIDM